MAKRGRNFGMNDINLGDRLTAAGTPKRPRPVRYGRQIKCDPAPIAFAALALLVVAWLAGY